MGRKRKLERSEASWPVMTRDACPPYYLMPWQRFQKFCCSLFETEATISVCNEYGPSGQSQHGIDLLAIRNDDGIEVAQCKCCKEFDRKDIDLATENFFDHWNYWRSRLVKRFALMVAIPLERTELHEAIRSQRQRFRNVGIQYEPWTAPTITDKLRLHPGIVSQYCEPAEYWTEVICGHKMPTFLPPRRDIPDTAISIPIPSHPEAISAITSEMDRTLALEIAEHRVLWQQGKEELVRQWFERVHSQKDLWTLYPPARQADILRFEASTWLKRDDGAARAISLADEAHRIAPEEDDSRLRSMILRRQGKLPEALACMEGKTDTDSLNLRASLLMQLSRNEEAIRILLDLEKEG